jgi:hypothetical protein
MRPVTDAGRVQPGLPFVLSTQYVTTNDDPATDADGDWWVADVPGSKLTVATVTGEPPSYATSDMSVLVCLPNVILMIDPAVVVVAVRVKAHDLRSVSSWVPRVVHPAGVVVGVRRYEKHELVATADACRDGDRAGRRVAIGRRARAIGNRSTTATGRDGDRFRRRVRCSIVIGDHDRDDVDTRGRIGMLHGRPAVCRRSPIRTG